MRDHKVQFGAPDVVYIVQIQKTGDLNYDDVELFCTTNSSMLFNQDILCVL